MPSLDVADRGAGAADPGVGPRLGQDCSPGLCARVGHDSADAYAPVDGHNPAGPREHRVEVERRPRARLVRARRGDGAGRGGQPRRPGAGPGSPPRAPDGAPGDQLSGIYVGQRRNAERDRVHEASASTPPISRATIGPKDGVVHDPGQQFGSRRHRLTSTAPPIARGSLRRTRLHCAGRARRRPSRSCARPAPRS